MSNIKIYLQDFDAIEQANMRAFDDNWDLPKRFALEYTSKQIGVAAAEEAFKIFNAPEEFLDVDELRLMKLCKRHSLSVGDVVQVDGIDYLCAGVGWKVGWKERGYVERMLHRLKYNK